MKPVVHPPSRRTFLLGAAAAAALAGCTNAPVASSGSVTSAAVTAGAGSSAGSIASAGGPGSSTGAGPSPAAVTNVFTPVVAAPLVATAQPVPATDGRWHVMYELQIANAKAAPATLLAVDVLSAADEQTVLAHYGPDRIAAALRTTFPRPASDPTIPPGELRFLYIELSFPTRQDVPAGVTHRFDLLAATNPGATEPGPLQYTIAPVTFPAATPLVLAPPLRGDGWVDINGAFNPLVVHRGSVQTVNGGFHIAQRYAIDFMRLDGAGRFLNGDPSDVTSNNAYGADIVAVADATVVEVLDELPDQPPGSLPDPASITMDTVDGNHIVLDLGNGLYGFYAHLARGSVAVRAGQTVRQGDVMAKLGNSGNTSAPHLHFHVMDGPSVLGSDGIPYVYDSLQVAGTIDQAQFDATTDFVGDWGSSRSAPVDVRDAFPMNLQIVNFR